MTGNLGKALPIETWQTNVPQQFETIVAEFGDRPALETKSRTLSYRELNEQVNQLAHYIRAECGDVNEPILLLLGYDDWAIISMLAVLKAGQCYVPVDSSFPLSKIQSIFQDCGASLILTNTKHLALAHNLANQKTQICNVETAGGGFSPQNPEFSVSPESLAYIIYTSGSTGNPKGVMHDQAYILWLVQTYTASGAITCEDRFALLYSPAFAGAVRDIFCTLLNGGTLLPMDVKNEGLPTLRRWMVDHRITAAFFVATLFRHFCRLLSDEVLGPPLRLIEIGSEAVHAADAELYKRFFPEHCKFIVNLGGSEISPVSQFLINKDTVITSPLPVGQPPQGIQIQILDDAGQPALINQPGEMVVGSRYLTRGYWQQPDLTNEKFVVDPKEPTQRLYYTGDLGMRLSDGNLVHLGRKDFQVKVRGYRIEITEVESALLALEGVREVVVAAPDDANGDRYLLAYIVPSQAGVFFSTSQLRAQLVSRLPDYMIPTSVLFLEKLPLTDTGKIDRRALPFPETLSLSESVPANDAQTEIERSLSGLWAELFGRKQVSVQHNFFDLGGHSLAATQLVSRIRTHFGVELPLRSILEHPVLQEQARLIELGDQTVQPFSIPPLEKHGPLPLSFAQQRLWFLSQLEAGARPADRRPADGSSKQSVAYTMSRGFRLQGPLDVQAIRKTFSCIVERHLSLRSRFFEVEAQVFMEPIPPYDPLVIVECGGMDETTFEEVIQKKIDQTYDLTKGELFRVHLFKLNDDEHVLLVGMHHIVSDGWSVGILVREWTNLYTAYHQNQPPALTALNIQYPDYAAWQKDWLSGEILDRQLTYWQTQLKGCSELLELPTDYPRPAVKSYQGARHVSQLPLRLSQQLQQLSKNEDATLFMTLLTAFNLFLLRHCQQSGGRPTEGRPEDICVGTPVANRTHRQTEELIGFFANTLVIRNQIDKKATFRETLKQTRQTCLDAYAHQDLPFEALVESLKPQRSLSHSPLFQVMFALQNTPLENPTLPEMDVMRIPLAATIAKFDLTLEIHEQEEQFILNWEYATDLFKPQTVNTMAKRFEVLLQGVVDFPERSVSQLPLLTNMEWQLLKEWNDTATDYPRQKSVVDLFEAQAQQTPENIAAVFEENSISYQQLNQKANQLAHYLIEQGVESGMTVGLCVERSLEMLVGLLGILKAGGAYVPLDPDYPIDRLQFMQEDARIKLMLTQSHLLKRLEPTNPPKTVLLDGNDSLMASMDNPPLRSRADDLAYVIYTSGSTGKPKGVCIPHQGIVRMVRQTDYQTFSSNDRIAQASTISFDAATYEIWGPLLNGGQLIGVAKNVALDPNALSQLVRQHKITSLFLTTALFNQLVAHLPEDFEPPKNMLFGGELADPQMVRKLLTEKPPQRLLNMYGPTENTTYSTWFLIPPLEEKREDVPIGYPIANSTVHILDSELQPTPIGVVGELCVGGDGLAMGYLNRPELTAEKFVKASVLGDRQERIYKTGDLARWRFDGTIEYLGRVDHQVKLRGFRIELGEIENVLFQHEGVQEAIVVVQEIGERKFLAAYVTSEQTIEPQTLSDFVKSHLPNYMLPSSFTILERLPLNPNGKIDRKALPVPEVVVFSEQIEPRNSMETLLCELWSQLLGSSVNSVTADFFEVGGHSLLATQLAARIRSTVGVEMPLRVIFEHPSLEAQSAWLENQTTETPLSPVVSQSHEAPPVLSFAQRRLWFLGQLDKETATYNMPMAFRLRGNLDMDALQSTLYTTVERHVSLRSCFPEVEGKATVRVLPPYNPLTVIDTSQASEAERDTLLQQFPILPFDLGTGPLFRVQLLKQGEQDYLLLLNQHHIISDGWSLGVMFREWTTLYYAYCQKQPSSLPPLAIQYTDYATWQRECLQGEVMAKQIDYWQEQLKGIPELLELPTDYLRPAESSFRGAKYFSELPQPMYRQLQELSRQQGATLFMTLLTAFSLLLARYSRQTGGTANDICVGTPVANRTQRETEDVIGFFVNTLVMRSQIDFEASFIEILQQTRHTCLDAYAHQDIPFESLVEVLNPSRSLSHNPLFQVMFALQGNAPEALAFSGVEVERIDMDLPIAKVDLTLDVTEANDRLIFCWEYAEDLFKAETIQTMATRFEVLLQGILEDAFRPVYRLPLMPSAEHDQLLQWTSSKIGHRPKANLADLFEAQARKNGQAIALVFENQLFSYDELNRQANQLAHYLKTQGVQPDTLVGIHLDRSPEQLISLLGVLKAGGAYIPLDPNYPTERLAFMIQDSKTPLLLSRTELAEHLTVDSATVICIDDERESIEKKPHHNPVRDSQPDHLAYVIYTSGSTGHPKGVMIEQASIVSHIRDLTARYGIEPSDRILQFASLNFDTSLEQVLTAWQGGGSLVLTRTNQLTAQDLIELIEQEKITIADLPPAYWQLVCQESIAPQCLVSLRLLIMGGDVLPTNLVQETLSRFPRLDIVNAYGPTEATITATLYKITLGLAQQEDRRSIPIGQPVGDTRVYLLDEHLLPCPIGIPGELCIAGPKLARGYLNQPELTAKRFIDMEFLGESQRIYKTGDLARWLPDGNIEFLGRVDYQVKLRGFRIELGEIENLLTQHKVVAEAVVVSHGSENAKVLAAYVTLHERVGSTELIDYLKAQLPEYMVPATVTILEKLPLTSNDKVDRKALPTPEISTVEQYMAPRNPDEAKLAALWELVLNREKIGIHDDFFELGGHSLLMTKLIQKIKESFGVLYSLRIFYNSPTIAKMMESIKKISTPNAPNKDPIVETLVHDAKLSSWLNELTIATKSAASPPNQVLLTGANGFVGMFLLDYLLRDTNFQIYCLVRAKTEQAAFKRLEKAHAQYQLEECLDRTRVIPLAGDLGKEKLGLQANQWETLCHSIDLIYHNGAHVHHLYPYASLKDANVKSTVQLIELASIGQCKPIHFVSTLGAAPRTEDSSEYFERHVEPTALPLANNGYVQSKWVSELLLQQAQQLGIPVTIYRLGHIGGDSRTGVCKTKNDHFLSLIKGCLQMQCAPRLGYFLELLPIDVASQIVVEFSQMPKNNGEVFHLHSDDSVPWQDYLAWFQEQGYELTWVSNEEWYQQLLQLDETNALHSLVPFYSEPIYQKKFERETPVYCEIDNTQAWLKQVGLQVPPAKALKQSHVTFLMKGMLSSL